jgi:hypothetical protein
MIRADYRGTLISQPDFWSKSQKNVEGGINTDPGTTLTVVGPVLDGAMRAGPDHDGSFVYILRNMRSRECRHQLDFRPSISDHFLTMQRIPIARRMSMAMRTLGGPLSTPEA